jgi:uncharacterized membrane protein
MTVGKQTQESFTLKERALLVGTTAITMVQQLPLNEMLVGINVCASTKMRVIPIYLWAKELTLSPASSASQPAP